MSENEANPLELAERRAREQQRREEEWRREKDAAGAAAAQQASARASQLVSHCLERLAQAGWPTGEKIHVMEQVWETVGLLRRRRQQRSTLINYEVWPAPAGVGYRIGGVLGTSGEWAKVYNDSQLAIDRDGTIWRGSFEKELKRRHWRRLDPPSNEAQAEALTEAFGAILAAYVPVPS